MPAALQAKPSLETAPALHSETMEWHQDCLVVSVLLASSLDQRAWKRHLKRADRWERSLDERPEGLLRALHEACHLDPSVRGAVAKELNAKYRGTVAKLQKMDQAQISEQVDEAPWLAPLLWACCVNERPEARQAGRRLAHLMLWQGMRRLAGRSQAEEHKERANSLAEQNHTLRSTLTDLRRENDTLKIQLRCRDNRLAPIPAPAPKQGTKKQLKQLKGELAEQKERVKELEEQVAVWRSLALQAEEAASAQTTPCLSPEPICEEPPEERTCPHQGCNRPPDCPLRGKSVAIIGGLDRLEPNYTQVIEQLGGDCICHTGHLRAGTRKLRQIVSKSDLVVFLTPINSHGAMNVVKKHCKQCKTRFCPLNVTSAAALETHLIQLAQSA